MKSLFGALIVNPGALRDRSDHRILLTASRAICHKARYIRLDPQTYTAAISLMDTLRQRRCRHGVVAYSDRRVDSQVPPFHRDILSPSRWHETHSFQSPKSSPVAHFRSGRYVDSDWYLT